MRRWMLKRRLWQGHHTNSQRGGGSVKGDMIGGLHPQMRCALLELPHQRMAPGSASFGRLLITLIALWRAFGTSLLFPASRGRFTVLRASVATWRGGCAKMIRGCGIRCDAPSSAVSQEQVTVATAAGLASHTCQLTSAQLGPGVWGAWLDAFCHPQGRSLVFLDATTLQARTSCGLALWDLWVTADTLTGKHSSAGGTLP